MGRTGNTAKVIAAVAGGYALGRRKKLKLAIGLGLYLATKNLNLDPRTLAKELSELPAVTELKGQARGQLSTIGKDTAGSMVSLWASNLADALNERTGQLRSESDEAGEQSGPGDDAGAEPATEAAAPRSGEEKTRSGSGSRAGKRSGGRGKGTGKGTTGSRSAGRSRDTRNSGLEGDQHG